MSGFAENKTDMASLKICNISAIPTGSSSTSRSSSNHPIPFSSNPITTTTTILSIKSVLSSFHHATNSVHPILSFHRKPHFSMLASKKSIIISSAMSSLYTDMSKRIFHQLLILLQTHLHSLMEQQGCIYLIHAPMHSVFGLPETGLQDKIKLVPIELKNRPAWYKERVYPPNKVPALEHNNEVKGESLDLIKYIDTHFEGPSLFPDDPAKRQFADELFSYIDTFYKTVTSSFKGEGTDDGIAFDDIEIALSEFEDGPFFLGQFSLVDIAYAPFIERFHPFFMDVKNYDITHGRPKLATWIEEMNKNEGYKQTRRDPKELVESYKQRFMARL
ncbi:glutathione S-transferase L3-like isoform X2 [Hibiscus syriacus]|uniref:glutathione S-transferase L3-like isoform X2 n=1 Tax=Hibiscus syriacus TaxID=106335 RepID=UPI0019219716|nr:glutathione S-transferase L3-like isoform X2 [Hibiscus syriacus]